MTVDQTTRTIRVSVDGVPLDRPFGDVASAYDAATAAPSASGGPSRRVDWSFEAIGTTSA